MTTRDEELSPVAQELVPAIRQKQKIEKRRGFLNALIWASVAALAVAGVYAFASLTTEDDVLRQTGTTNSKNINDLQDQMKGVCRKVSNPNQLTPQERDGCYRAENSIPPSNVTITEQPNINITGLSAAEAQDMINQSVANLPKPLTVDQVTAAATAVYQANKPKEFTPEDIRQQVVLFCGINQCQGKQGIPGIDGKDAPPATPDEVYAQVDVWCKVDDRCRSTTPGPIGPSPPCLSEPMQCQGVGVASMALRRLSLTDCVLHVEYTGQTRPGDAGSVTQDIPVDPLICPA
jgi:hypothetical protein